MNMDDSIDKPFFSILGFQRSGTTLLRLLVDSHSKIAIPFESFVLVDFAKRYEQEKDFFDDEVVKERFVKDLLACISMFPKQNSSIFYTRWKRCRRIVITYRNGGYRILKPCHNGVKSYLDLKKWQ